jgi:hypothetical protein
VSPGYLSFLQPEDGNQTTPTPQDPPPQELARNHHIDRISIKVHSRHIALAAPRARQTIPPTNSTMAAMRANPPDWVTDRYQWDRLNRFMNTRREKSPYPKYLYRYMAPQYEGSVQNLIEIESDAYTESDCYNIGSGNTDGTLSSFFEELEFQLSKYQNQLKGQRSNYDCALVSLSGDFRWVVQKAAKIYYSPHKKECPGVAIVETARATADDCFVWRVSDLFDYFDTIFELDNPYCSASFSRSIRYWADNAHEYVVWSHVPRRAMVSFVPASMLAPLINPIS